ncbi:MAG: RNA polymerase sigma factor [Bacteroidales bacterium]|nr:RNA polymerase sigma factor [Bacteroidales bacterium]
MNNPDLVQELKEGNQSAFRQLVETYQQMVINTALGFVGNIENANDIAQEVFLEIFRSIHSFREQSALSTWIYRITITRSLNYIRREKRFSGQLHESADESSSLSDNPEQKLEEADRKMILHNAINRLPKNQQIALTLHNFEDLPYKEIARVMNRSVSSVEALIFRARKNLQKKLWNWYKNSQL